MVTTFIGDQVSEGVGIGGLIGFGATRINVSTEPRFLHPDGFAGAALAVNENPIRYPQTSGTLKNFIVHHNQVGSGGFTITYTVVKNDVDTDLFVTMLDSDETGTNTFGTESFALGDKLAVRVDKNGTLVTEPKNITAVIGVV